MTIQEIPRLKCPACKNSFDGRDLVCEEEHPTLVECPSCSSFFHPISCDKENTADDKEKPKKQYNYKKKANGKNDVGRPCEYKEEYCDMVDAYLLSQEDEYKKNKLTVKLPTLEHFAEDFLKVSYRVILDWEKQFPDFLQALNRLRHAQKQRVLERSLSNLYNSTIAKLILSSNHGMSEKSDLNLGGQVDNPLIVVKRAKNK